ncbi:MAG: tetratricopeptide repeat protein, partial [Myxococcaceae bacterium]|nr:tetratricopeptide repeat protein [Myxococcaceae bacterium]
MTPHDILLHMEVPKEPGVFVLGSFERRVTLYSQQVRALNLIHALFAERRLKDGDRVAIVGGGAAGMTAAAGAAVRGCKVTLLEQAEDLLLLFRNNRLRWVHPHIYDWPEPSSEDEQAGLPLLDWRAGEAGQVAEQILAGWTPLQEAFGIQVRCKVRDVQLPSASGGERLLTWNSPGHAQGRFTAVILAVGFGIEKQLKGIPFISYWKNDGLDHRSAKPGRSKYHYLVSGTGDGGLIDLLRIRIANFRHERIVQEFLSAPSLDKVRAELLSIEEDVRQGRLPPDRIYEKYCELEVPSALDGQLRQKLRGETSAVLNGLGSAPLDARSCVLNRFLASRLLRLDVPYKEGEFKAKRTSAGFNVTFPESTTPEHFDEIVVRHGPLPAVDQFPKVLPKKAQDELHARAVLDQTRRPIWKNADFDWNSPPVRSSPTAPSPAPPRMATLPTQGDCLGREELVRTLVAELMSPAPRPTTILGPPGIGKSTVAIEALYAPEVEQRYGSRRYFIRLDGATSHESMIGTIAAPLGVTSETDLWGAVKARLGEAPALLVLDNGETPWHADGPGTEGLLRELRGIHGLALVCTVRGEDGPSIPRSAPPIRVKPLGVHDARALFCSIADNVAPEDPHLSKLLAELDGLPLAITPLAHIAQGPPLSLTRQLWQQNRGSLPGLSSLATAVETSLKGPRMTDAARRLLALLTLLPAGIAEADLEPLMPREGVEAASVLIKVALCFFEGSRLRMLAPIREQVARTLPPTSLDLERLRAHYFALARDEGDSVGRAGGAKAVAHLTAEFANIESLVSTSLEGRSSRGAITAAVALTRFIHFSGYAGSQIIHRALVTARSMKDLKSEANCIQSLGDIALARSQHEEARHLFEQARPLFQQVGSILGEANCIQRLGDIALARSQHEEARRLFEQARPLFQQVGSILGEANCIQRLGDIALARSQHEEARRLFEQARPLYQRVGDILGEANCIRSLGDIALRRSQHEEA